MSMDTEQSTGPAVIKVSGSGGIAALISKTSKTGQLKNITKKDQTTSNSPGRLQRLQSVPDDSSAPKETSKVTFRSISVTPSVRANKSTSVVVLSRAKSPPTKLTSEDHKEQGSPTSQSSGVSSFDMEETSIFEDLPSNQSDPSKPVPKPRLVKQATSEDLPITREPLVENLKCENEVLKQQISRLKEQHSELEMENKVLRDHVQSSGDELDSPVPSPDRKPRSNSKSTPIPRSSTVSSSSGVKPRHKAIEQTDSGPKTPGSPVPKPRSGSRPSLPTIHDDEKVKAVKTLQALLPAAGSQKKEKPRAQEPRGPDGLSRTERSLLQMQELMKASNDTEESVLNPMPKSRSSVTDAPATQQESKSESVSSHATKPLPPTPSGNNKRSSKETTKASSRGTSRPSSTSSIGETTVPRPSSQHETSRPSSTSSVTRPSPQRETSRPSSTGSGETSITRPSPQRETSSTTKPLPPAPSKGSEVTRPSATRGTPSSNETTTETNTRDSQQTPKELLSAPPRPPPPSQVRNTPRVPPPAKKSTQIKSDVSWIKRKDSIENYDSRSTISASQTMPDLDQPSPTPHQPYRSHAIISTPTPSSGSSYVPPPLNSDPKPSESARTQARTVVKGKVQEVANNKRREHSLTRSTSDDNIASRSSKDKKGNGKDHSPPKKPPRLRVFKTSSDSRPISMFEDTGCEAGKSRTRDFTSSYTAGTLRPNSAPPSSKSPRGSRKAVVESTGPSKPERKGLLGRFKSKTQYKSEAPPLQEEPDEDESSSDDEKGGTIRRMPRLRHVPDRSKSLEQLDDSEPEYHQLFEYVFVVGLKDKGKGALDTEVTYTFPPAPEQVFSGKDAALLSIPQFCFPDIDQWKPTKSYKSESFSFVLTDIEGGRRFGYCRRLLPSGKGARLPEVFCIVSPLGCFSLYEKILDHVEERRAVSSASVFSYLKAIQANPFPRPGRSVEVQYISTSGLETVVLTRPMDSRLEHVDFSILFSTLSPRKIIQLFSALLMERRVILSAHSLSLLTGCAHALLALLYPFEWQHVFIPVLPNNLIDFVCSPLPYIIGISPSLIKQLDSMEMEEALVIDLEKKKFAMKVGDEASILPTKLFQFLEHSLGSSVVSSQYLKKSASPTNRADEIVVNTFMTFFTYLYGDYKSHMKVVNPSTREREFQRTEFVKTFSSKSTRRFLEAFQMTQLFENFIEQRENPAKEETTAASHFEQQLSVLQPRCQDIEIFSSKSKFDRWKLVKGAKKK